MPKITPFLWFDTQAEEAARFYVSVFEGSKMGSVTPGPDGRALTVQFELAGEPFIALNGGPHFKFTEAVSFSIECDTQEEIDRYWSRLTEGGEESRCGWLKDRYGLSWQVVPRILPGLLQDPDRERAGRVMNALLAMGKIDLAALQRAHDGE